MSKCVKSCHVWQLAGKPNQTIPQAPLQPIPVMGEAFERLLIDCVGPLPKTKCSFQYILTIMCTATHYPEAILLCSIKTKAVEKELKFCSAFGQPKVIQTDQGSNFTSHVFEQIVQELESQGILEWFHQTLKSMIRAYCIEIVRTVRGTKQESLGFSPAELVLGHMVRGPWRPILLESSQRWKPVMTRKVLCAVFNQVIMCWYYSLFRAQSCRWNFLVHMWLTKGPWPLINVSKAGCVT